MFHIGFFINFFIVISVSFGVRYDNYTLFRAIPVTEKQLAFFKNLSDKMTVDFWREAGSLRKPVDFLISPDTKEEFLKHAKNYRIILTTLLLDVQAAFDKQTVTPYVRRNMHTFNWSSYYRLDDIYEWLQDLATEYSNIVKIQTIGNTDELRNIKAIRVIHKTADNRKDRPKVIVEGGIHAREWVAISFVTYLLDKIVKAPLSSDTELKEISLQYEWYFVPVLNPDGYEYTHTKDRSWRKNRGQDGFGVDLNRNFGEGFGTNGASQTKTSQSYCGPAAFSERETVTMRGYVNAQKKNLKYYLAFHNYGQAMIIPYAHRKEHLDNYDEVKKMCNHAAESLKRVHGKKFISGNCYETLGYIASGVSACWVKKTFKVPYVTVFELRDEGEYGFSLPLKQIEPACRETLAAVKTFVRFPRRSQKARPLTSAAFKKLCSAAADRMFEIHHSKYAVGNLFETFGFLSSGTSGDWVKSSHNVQNVLEMELGDSGRYALALPAHDLLNICEKTFEGVKTILRQRDDTINKRSTDDVEDRNWSGMESIKESKQAEYSGNTNLRIKPKLVKKSVTSNASFLSAHSLAFVCFVIEVLIF